MRPYGDHQSISLTKKILFDFSIENVAQQLTKLADIVQIECEANTLKNILETTNEYTLSMSRITFQLDNKQTISTDQKAKNKMKWVLLTGKIFHAFEISFHKSYRG